MRQFIKLVQNELYKYFFGKKVFAFLICMMMSIFLFAIINNVNQNSNWRNETKEQISRLNQSIKEQQQIILDENIDEKTRTVEKSVLEYQREELKIKKYRLKKDIPENIITPLKFVYKCKEMFFIVTIFMIILSANLIVNEYKEGTIRQLFIKPISRTEIFWAKYFSTILMTFALSIFLLVISILFGYLFFFKNSTSIYEVKMNNGIIEMENMFVAVVRSTIVNIIMVCILNAISICISVIANNNMLSVFATLGIWLGNTFVGDGLKNNIIYKNFIVANISLDNFLPGGILPYKGATIEKALIICIIYIIIILLVANKLFLKKEIY